MLGTMHGRFVLAIDQGTSSTKALLVDETGTVVRTGSSPVPIRYPRPGWVEQEATEILDSVLVAATQCLDGVEPGSIAAVGLSTQRESAVAWDLRTGRPTGPVLGWQDQRGHTLCDRLKSQGHANAVRRLSGLPLSPMFSAAKLRWLLDQAPGAIVGTVDAFLVYALSGAHQIEIGNASRTQLLDVRTGRWSEELLEVFGIPERALPEVTPSAGPLARIGEAGGPLAGLPITAVLGDSHAALFAHGAFADGGVKVTYGTGSSVMRLVTEEQGDHATCLTVAWGLARGQPGTQLAAEGNIRSSGATVAWLADLLDTTPERIADLAASAECDNVHLVPAFGGLAAPWWDDDAIGVITGLTLGTGAPQLARAAVESIAHQVADVVEAVGPARRLLADGGASANDHLMQLQADITGLEVKRARTANLSALGTAFLAGQEAGFDPRHVEYDDFLPRPVDAAARRTAWRDAVARARSRSAPSAEPGTRS